MLAAFGRCPELIVIYLIACDSLADDLGVLVDPNVGSSAEHAGEHFGEHVNKISKYLTN